MSEARSETRRREEEELMLRLAQREYRQYGELEELTREIASAMDHDDQVSIRMLLKMRGNTIEELEKTRRDQQTLLNTDSEWRRRITEITAENGAENMTKAEEKIRTLSNGKKEILKRTIALDKQISIRLAGEDSYYSK